MTLATFFFWYTSKRAEYIKSSNVSEAVEQLFLAPAEKIFFGQKNRKKYFFQQKIIFLTAKKNFGAKKQLIGLVYYTSFSKIVSLS